MWWDVTCLKKHNIAKAHTLSLALSGNFQFSACVVYDVLEMTPALSMQLDALYMKV